jgi:putative colanic acid biosynthesis glycosyltransferase
MYLTPDGRQVLRKAKTGRYSLYGMPGIHQSMVYPRKPLVEIGYPTSFHICGDYALTASIYKSGVPFTKIDLVLATFSTGGRSYQQPLTLLREAARVQREVLRLPKATVGASMMLRGLSAARLRLIHSKPLAPRRAWNQAGQHAQ